MSHRKSDPRLGPAAAAADVRRWAGYLRAFVCFVGLVSYGTSRVGGEEVRLLQSWQPNQAHVAGRKMLAVQEELRADLHHPPSFDRDGRLRFDRGQFAAVEPGSVALPQAGFSVATWVRIDRPIRWGSIVGYQQDNGADEKGWSLGYNLDRFEFRVSDGRKLINCTAPAAMTVGGWHHVVGVCDPSARQLRLSVDGMLVTTIAFDSDGPVYPASLPTDFVIGAYKDKDELFPLSGRIELASLYEGILSPASIAEQAADRSWRGDAPLPFSVRPGVRFLTPTSAEVRWETTLPGKSMVAFGESRKLGRLITSEGQGTSHRAVLDRLEPGKSYHYRFGLMRDGKRSLSPFYELAGDMNYMPPAVSAGKLPTGGQQVIDRIDQRGGYAVVLVPEAAQWSEAIAAESTMTVVAALESDEEIQRLRTKWYGEDRYGIRLTAQRVSDLPSGLANLVIADAGQFAVARRCLSPSGRLVCLGETPPDAAVRWSRIAPGIHWGEPNDVAPRKQWGHQYGTPGNTSFVGESLGGVDNTKDLAVRWIGRPGADFGIDRNPRMPAPLATGGRLFHQGMNRMIALDAFNGAVLWSLEIPDLRRVNIPRDCGNWCADRETVFAAVDDRLWVIDAASGEMRRALELPSAYRKGHQWGYIGDGGDVLIGTAMKTSSAYESFWDSGAWYDGTDDTSTAKVCGTAIAAYDKQYGNLIWQRPVDAVVHSTITIANGDLYFVEVTDSRLRDVPTGKLKNDQIWDRASVVCLDQRTGKERWRQPVPRQQPGVVVSFAMADEERFLLETSSQGKFHITSLDRDTGETQWSASVGWPSDNHGAHMQHAVLMNGKVYVQPHILDAADGRLLKTGTLGKRRGCATPIGVGDAIIYRGGTGPLTLWSLRDESPSEFTRLRPSCWLSTIPAQGMLFSPEGGGGCSCGGWMETSIGFAPLTELQ